MRSSATTLPTHSKGKKSSREWTHEGLIDVRSNFIIHFGAFLPTSERTW